MAGRWSIASPVVLFLALGCSGKEADGPPIGSGGAFPGTSSPVAGQGGTAPDDPDPSNAGAGIPAAPTAGGGGATGTERGGAGGAELSGGAAGAPTEDSTGGSAAGGAASQPNPAAAIPGVCAGFNNGSGSTVPCATTAEGKAVCFQTSEPVTLTFDDGTELTSVQQVTGQNFSTAACAIVEGGAVHCGQHTTISKTPVIAAGASMVSGSLNGGCAIVDDGGGKGASCWGDVGETIVQLGAEVPKQVACYYHGCCVTTESGQFLCWGDTTAIGTPMSTAAAPVSPATVPGKVLQAGPGQDHICAVFEGGRVQCWGADWNKQLGGLGESKDSGVTLVESGALAVASGQFHTCVLLSDGKVQCVSASQTEGAGLDMGTLTEVSGISGAVALSAGKHYSCARLADATVQCWGTISGGSTPTTISGLVTRACD